MVAHFNHINSYASPIQDDNRWASRLLSRLRVSIRSPRLSWVAEAVSIICLPEARTNLESNANTTKPEVPLSRRRFPPYKRSLNYYRRAAEIPGTWQRTARPSVQGQLHRALFIRSVNVYIVISVFIPIPFYMPK